MYNGSINGKLSPISSSPRCGGSGSPSNTMFFWRPRMFNPNRILIRSAVLHGKGELSRVTDRQTDTAIICSSSLHLMHSTQPKNCLSPMTKKLFKEIILDFGIFTITYFLLINIFRVIILITFSKYYAIMSDIFTFHITCTTTTPVQFIIWLGSLFIITVRLCLSL